MTHVERDVEVDLHHTIVMPTARLRPSPALLFEAVRTVPGSRFSVLAPTEMVLHATAHLFYGSDFTEALRELVDIADLLGHFGGHEPGFWEGFWARAVQLDLERPAYYALKFVGDILDFAVPPGVSACAESGRPGWLPGCLMEMAVPAALLPGHPCKTCGARVRAARLGLYVRSHWVKMPWLLLTRHLLTKARVLGASRLGTHRSNDVAD
jgi:hypothetical protein